MDISKLMVELQLLRISLTLKNLKTTRSDPSKSKKAKSTNPINLVKSLEDKKPEMNS